MHNRLKVYFFMEKFYNTPQKEFKLVPWFDWRLWENTFNKLFSQDAIKQKEGTKIVSSWVARGRVPTSVTATSSLVDLFLLDTDALTNEQLRMCFGMTLVRFY